MTRDDMSMEVTRGITEDNPSNNTVTDCMQDTFARATHSAYAAARPSARATIGYLVYNVTDITPTNSPTLCKLNSTTHTVSDFDHNISIRDTTTKETSSFELNQTLEIDVDTVPKETNTRKRSKKQSKGTNGKKDKCPCLTSDTKSWKPKCSNCNQTWHTACCNLLGITSIIELENWQCPWCYEPLFADPSQPKTVMNALKEIHIDVNSIQNKCDNLSTLDLQKQISELEEIVSKLKTPFSDPECIN